MFSVSFFFKQKTAYEMRISDWSSDVCSSDLAALDVEIGLVGHRFQTAWIERSEDVKGTAVDRGLSLDAVPCADGGAELVADPIGQLTERGEGAGVKVRTREVTLSTIFLRDRNAEQNRKDDTDCRNHKEAGQPLP